MILESNNHEGMIMMRTLVDVLDLDDDYGYDLADYGLTEREIVALADRNVWMSELEDEYEL